MQSDEQDQNQPIQGEYCTVRVLFLRMLPNNSFELVLFLFALETRTKCRAFSFVSRAKRNKKRNELRY